MKKIVVALFASLLFVLTACGASVTAGTVTDKNFKEAYTTEEEIMEQECEKDTDYVGTGKKRKKVTRNECEEVGTGEFETIEHPAEYTLSLEDEKGNEGTVDVTEDEYNSVEVGDFFDSEQ